MKVVMVSRAVWGLHGFGGMERYVYFLSKYLAKNGCEVEIITAPPTQTAISVRKEDFEVKEITFLPPRIDKRFSNPIQYWLFVRNCAKYLKNVEFDVLHAHGMTAYHYLKRTRNRRPTVVQPFGSEEFKARKEENFIKRIYLDLFIRNPKLYCLHHADAVASEGDLQSRELVELFHVPREKIFILPDGVELGFIQRCISNSRITRRELGIDDADLVLINVNRLAPNKGVNYLIDALWLLNNQVRLNVKLILVGTGPEEPKIKAQMKKLRLEDKVVHFKNIPDEKMFQLYTLADISVTPTLYEGLPLVVLEAMACGKPIVASNVSEIPQVVKHGENGFLVPPRDPNAIANAVLEIYDRDLFKKMGNKSKEIVKDYDWSIIAKKAISKYEELMRK
jgi:glycosyltransferase involved in cell wall biosynthesis